MPSLNHCFIFLTLAVVLVRSQHPTEPVACTNQNKGHCECGDTSQGFHTYTFWIGNDQRCFTVFIPPERASESLPVVFHSQCYAGDALQGIDMVSSRSPFNAAAARYGFVRIGLSSPDHTWTFGNNGIVNDDTPMPCSNSDSKDMAYMRKIFDFIDAQPAQFDSKKMYAEGFSQNAVFSAFLGFCFGDKVIGIVQGGSGLALTGSKPYFPGCQGQVTASEFEQCHIKDCDQCTPCKECQYWPIYPCYSSKRPMIDCLVEYVNDPISVDQGNPDEHSSSLYMYEKLVQEGHDARVFRFAPSGNNQGGHRPPDNFEYWQIGCLGITTPCTKVRIIDRK